MSKKNPSFMRRMHGLMFKLPLMISCEEFEDFILAYLDGEVTRRQKLVFEMHLGMCRECREYLRTYQASLQLAKDAMATSDAEIPEDVPEDLVKAVLAARNA